MPDIGEIRRGASESVRWDGSRWQPLQEGPGTAESLGVDYGLPAVGAIVGGKTPLGPIGSGIGAATGQAYGDLYKMMMSATNHPGYGAIPTPGEEASKLATTAGLTTLGEKVIPPVLRGVSSVIPKGMMGGRLGAGSLAGYLFGHPAAGAVAGAAAEAAPTVANAVEWVGTPAGAAAGREARAAYLQQAGRGAAGNPALAKIADQVGKEGQRLAAGPWGEVPNYLQHPLDSARSALSGGVDLASEAADAAHTKLMSLGKMLGLVEDTPLPAAPAAPRVPTPPSGPSAPTFADVTSRTGTGIEGRAYPRPNLSNTPSISHGADVGIPEGVKWTPTPEAQAPHETEWSDLANRLGVKGGKVSTKGAKYTVDAPAAGGKGPSESPFGPRDLGAAAAKPGPGPAPKPADLFDPAKLARGRSGVTQGLPPDAPIPPMEPFERSEFPFDNPSTPPKRWIAESNRFANSQEDPGAVEAIRARLKPLLDLLSSRPPR